ncbi:hypothetical protein D3C87_1395110 [compost metagenome]
MNGRPLSCTHTHTPISPAPLAAAFASAVVTVISVASLCLTILVSTSCRIRSTCRALCASSHCSGGRSLIRQRSTIPAPVNLGPNRKRKAPNKDNRSASVLSKESMAIFRSSMHSRRT